MLSDKLLEQIKKKAEAYAEKKAFRVPFDGTKNFYDDKNYESSLAGYTSGQVDAINFHIWARKNGYYFMEDGGFDAPSESRYYSYGDLLKKYSETKSE